MNALLRIQVEVAAREAQAQLRSLSSTIQSVSRASSFRGGGTSNLTAGAKSANTELTALGRLSQKISGDFDRSRMGMIQLGKDMQWVGRQINFNFTLPLLLAGRSVMGWALENERAMTRIQKVYGDGTTDITNDLKLLEKGFDALSTIYGVNKAAVIELGAQWAAAGLKGAQLAKTVETSLKLSILGDYPDAAATFKDLVTIQTAYRLSAQQLELVIADLNAVENDFAIQLPDLVTGIARAGGSAKAAGVDFRHLAAMMAVLTPATGGAAQAGNSLKSVFAKLMDPTKRVTDRLKEIGIDTNALNWQQENASQRLEQVAAMYGKATDNQKSFIAGTLGTLFQVSKMNVLLDDMSRKTGTYAKVLELLSTKNDPKNLRIANQEIQTLLASDPKKLDILINSIKNLLAQAIVPLIPVLISVISYVRAAVQWFGNLSPSVLKLIAAFMVLIASVGIVAQVFGSFQLLFGVMGKFMIFLLDLLPGVNLMVQSEAVSAQEAAVAIVAASEEQTAAVVSSAAAISAASAEIIAAITTMASAVTAALTAEATAAATVVAEAASAEELILAETVAAETATMTGFAATLAAIGETLFLVLTNPYILAAAAIIVLIVVFHKQIEQGLKAVWKMIESMAKANVQILLQVVSWVGRGLSSLPGVVGNVLINVLQVVRTIILKIVAWLSYLNPFAHHSPSLVENVTAGIDIIVAEYKRLQNIGNPVQSMAADLQAFADATAAAIAAGTAADRADQTKKILEVAPGAGPSLGTLYDDMDRLKSVIDPLNVAIKAQEDRLKPLKAAYDAASAAVDNFQNSMVPLQKTVDADKAALDAAQQALDDYSNVTIIGMKAASDATFENEMAQKRLQLQLLQLGDAGQGYDDLLNKISALNGEIEGVHATIADLHQAGAGSDVLRVYQDQLASLEAQKAGLEASAQTGADLTQQLKDLQHQADIMDLQNSLQFDPLLRQINDLTHATKELSFEDIIAGIKNQKVVVADLTATYNRHKAALDDQQRILDGLIATRDALKITYDNENTALDVLKTQLSDYQDQLTQIEDAIKRVLDAQAQLTANKGAGAGGGSGYGGLPNFTQTPEQIGQAVIDAVNRGMLGAGGSLDKTIQDMVDRMNKMFSGLNPFKWFQDKWQKFLGWWHGVFGPILNAWLDRWTANILNWSLAIPAFFYTMFFDILHAVETFSGDIFTKFSEVGQSIFDGVTTGSAAVWTFFTNLPQNILDTTGDVSGWLVQKGIDFITGLLTGTVTKGEEYFAWFLALPSMTLEKIGDVSAWLIQKGTDFIGGLVKGVGDKSAEIWSFFTALPGNITTKIGDVAGWLTQKGIDFIAGLDDGIIAKAEDVWNFFILMPSRITGYIGDAVTWLLGKGNDIIAGLWTGITIAVVGVVGWFVTLGERILSWVGNLGGLLYDVGVAVIQGLYDGAKSLWDRTVGGWFSNIANTIKDIFKKGLVMGSPSKVMHNIGFNIMQGLQNGMEAGFRDIPTMLDGMTAQIVNSMGGMNTSFGLGLSNSELTTSLNGQPVAKNITFTGDLSFPNITSPDDAAQFIKNLEVLAESGSP